MSLLSLKMMGGPYCLMVQGSLQVACSQAIPADSWMLEQVSLVRIISIPHQMLQCPLSSHLSSSPDLYSGSVKNFPSWSHVKGSVTWVVALQGPGRSASPLHIVPRGHNHLPTSAWQRNGRMTVEPSSWLQSGLSGKVSVTHGSRGREVSWMARGLSCSHQLAGSGTRLDGVEDRENSICKDNNGKQGGSFREVRGG